MEAHEYANLFPMLSDAELKSLANDILANGLQTPIVTFEGKILDGRNRFRACEIAGTDPKLEAFLGTDALTFVISHNLHRRHLTESQRAMVAAKLATIRNGDFSGNQYSPPPIGGHQKIDKKTRDDAAHELKVGTSSLDRARRVQRDGSAELNAAVESGEITVNAAEKISKLPHEEQAEIVKQGAEAVREKGREIHGTRTNPVIESEPETVVVDESKSAPSGKWIPDDADRLWLLARQDLNKILPSDKSRERVLKEVIAYAQARLEKNK